MVLLPKECLISIPEDLSFRSAESKYKDESLNHFSNQNCSLGDSVQFEIFREINDLLFTARVQEGVIFPSKRKTHLIDYDWIISFRIEILTFFISGFFGV